MFSNLLVCVQINIKMSIRDIQVRISEHVPEWLQKQIKSNDSVMADDKYPSFFIAKHIFETVYMLDRNSAFAVLYKRYIEGRFVKDSTSQNPTVNKSPKYVTL